MNEAQPIPETRIALVYVYPIFGEPHDALARRFAETYRRYQPQPPHELVIVSNGGPATAGMRKVFENLACAWLEHDDTGWDIGAYRKAAALLPCDLMVFLGGSSHLRGPGWLERILETFALHGPALYGAMGSHLYDPHIRTTGWWCPPALLNGYPYPVNSEQSSRYQFEHGPNSITRWALRQGLKALMVTWHGVYEAAQWATIPNGFQQGDQSALIIGDRLVP